MPEDCTTTMKDEITGDANLPRFIIDYRFDVAFFCLLYSASTK
jgi:hypothetical protein